MLKKSTGDKKVMHIFRGSIGQDRDPDPFENDPIRKNKKWIADPRSMEQDHLEIVDPDPKVAILTQRSRSCPTLNQSKLVHKR